MIKEHNPDLSPNTATPELAIPNNFFFPSITRLGPNEAGKRVPVSELNQVQSDLNKKIYQPEITRAQIDEILKPYGYKLGIIPGVFTIGHSSTPALNILRISDDEHAGVFHY